MTRDELRESVVPKIDSHNVALLWATGLGKSRGAIEMVNRLYNSNPNLKVLLIVAETAHKDNWAEEFKRWKYKPKNTTVECYASLKKYNDTSWDVIIFDEAHHLNSDLRMGIIATIKANRIILLTATIDINLAEYIEELYGELFVSSCPLADAISQGMLPKPKIYLIGLELNNTKATEDIKIKKGKGTDSFSCSYEDRFKYLASNKYPNLHLTIRCTEKQKYVYYCDNMEYWKKQFMLKRTEYLKRKWLGLGSERKRFLGLLKNRPAFRLLGYIQNLKYICFCTNIAQAEYLSSIQGGECIHSEKSDVRTIINNFNKSKFKHLFAVGMLQEGQNVEGIEAGVIIQLDGKERSFIQRFGRTLRAKNPIQFIFYFKDTQDETYLNRIVEGLDSNYIEYVSINEMLNSFTG